METSLRGGYGILYAHFHGQTAPRVCGLESSHYRRQSGESFVSEPLGGLRLGELSAPTIAMRELNIEARQPELHCGR